MSIPGVGSPLTVVIVPCQVLGVDEKVVICVQLPEFTVNDVEMLVGEIVCDLVNVILLFQQGQRLNKQFSCVTE